MIFEYIVTMYKPLTEILQKFYRKLSSELMYNETCEINLVILSNITQCTQVPIFGLPLYIRNFKTGIKITYLATGH